MFPCMPRMSVVVASPDCVQDVYLYKWCAAMCVGVLDDVIRTCACFCVAACHVTPM